MVPALLFKDKIMSQGEPDYRLFKAINNGGLPLKEEVLHEPFDSLSDEAQDITRIVHSMMEELEAVGVYNQRMEGTKTQSFGTFLNTIGMKKLTTQ